MRIDPRTWLKLPLPTILLGLVAFAMVAASVAVALGGTQATKLLATPASPPVPLNIGLAAVLPAPDLAAIQSQPLMHANRGFYVAPSPDATPVVPPLPEYRLAGSFIVPDKPAVALLANKQSGTTRRVRVGDDLDGWRVESIESKRVTLKWQEQQRDISALTGPLSAGLKRVPVQRQRITSNTGTIQPLGLEGAGRNTGARGFEGVSNDTPRLYRPPQP